MTRPLVLLSNDDGISSPGLRALARRLADLGDVIVSAPDRERSATSHAFTLDRPLRVEEIEPGFFTVDGTPADCVYLGLMRLCPRKPDLVLTGINHGYNLGSDVFYSGTVAAAVEAALRGVPAIALSLEWRRDAPHGTEEPFGEAARFAHALGRAVLGTGLPAGTLLNVNVPLGPPLHEGAAARAPLRGYRWTRLGKRVYREQVDERADLRGRRYYWIGGPATGYGDVPGSDCHAIQEGVVSVTPLGLDLTHDGLLAQLPSWSLEGFDRLLERDLENPSPGSGV